MPRIHPIAPWSAALALLLSMAGAIYAQGLVQTRPQAAASAPAQPLPYELTIGHQDASVPMRVLIESGELEKATGYKIKWRMFGGGGDVLKAMEAGEVQVGEAASTAIAAATSQSQGIKLFWILDDIADAEALVARPGTNINSVKDLKGKRVATPFGSTSHYQLMAALKQAGLERKDLDLQNMRPQEISSAWARGEIDAAFIWDPVLTRIKFADKTVKVPKVVKVDKYDKAGKNIGKVSKVEMVDKVEKVPNKILATSGSIARKAFSAFDGLVVSGKWAVENETFMLALVQALARADEDYRKNGAKWTAESPQVKALANVTRTQPREVPDAMKLFRFPTLAEQASPRWLGRDQAKPGTGSAPDAGAAKVLADTAAFLKALNRVQEVKTEYKYYVTDEYVKKALPAKQAAAR